MDIKHRIKTFKKSMKTKESLDTLHTLAEFKLNLKTMRNSFNLDDFVLTYSDKTLSDGTDWKLINIKHRHGQVSNTHR